MYVVTGLAVYLCVVELVVTGEPQRLATHRQTRDYASEAQNRKTQECNTEQMEYRLGRLESQVDQRSEHLIAELRQGNRRLQHLEYENEKLRTTIEDLRKEMERYALVQEPSRLIKKSTETQELGQQIDILSQDVKLMIVALRKVNSDVMMMKGDLSKLKESTNIIIQKSSDGRTTGQANGTSKIPRSCKDIRDEGNNPDSGIYLIQPENSPESFLVKCEMSVDGGGWTYIQHRVDGSQDFFQDFESYKSGFGNLAGEFWLGLEYIHQLTGHKMNELRIELMDHTNVTVYAHYNAFSIGSSEQGYSLNVLGRYTGTAGDSLSYHAGAKFSAKDHDVDTWKEGSCALSHKGAWWYKECDRSNLNGLYAQEILTNDHMYQVMYWNEFGGPMYSLKASRMLIRG